MAWAYLAAFCLKNSWSSASRGIDGLLEIVGRDDGVVELHLGALLPVGFADSLVGDGDAAGDEGLQPVQLHVLLDLGFEVGAIGAEGGVDEVHVLVVADVLAVGKEVLGEGAGLELAAEVFVGDLEVHAVGLLLEDGALDENLAGAVHHVGQKEVGELLLLQLAGGEALDVLRLDFCAFAEEPAKDAWLMNGGEDSGVRGALIVEQSGDEVDHHRDNGGADDYAKEDLGELAVLLEKPNHCLSCVISGICNTSALVGTAWTTRETHAIRRRFRGKP